MIFPCFPWTKNCFQRLSAQPQYILHIVQTWRLVLQPDTGAGRATGEHITAHGAVADFDALSHADKIDRVLTDDITAAHRLHADFSVGAFTAHSFAVVVSDLVVIAPEGLSHHFPHAYCCAGWGILFFAVVQFDDFHVKIITKNLGSFFKQFEAGIDADTHVRRQHHGNRFGKFFDLLFLLGVEPGGTADQHFAMTGADGQIIQSHFG